MANADGSARLLLRLSIALTSTEDSAQKQTLNAAYDILTCDAFDTVLKQIVCICRFQQARSASVFTSSSSTLSVFVSFNFLQGILFRFWVYVWICYLFQCISFPLHRTMFKAAQKIHFATFNLVFSFFQRISPDYRPSWYKMWVRNVASGILIYLIRRNATFSI